MSINFDAIKADLERLNRQTSKKSSGDESMFWSPKEGEQTVRIVPYIHERSDSFRRFYYHYDIAEKPFVSPISFGQRDPIVDFAKKLQNESGDKESWKFAKNLEPKMRVYLPVLVRGLEHKGVLFWGFTEKVYKDLAKFLVSGEYGDISDLQNGRDIVIDYTPRRGNSYPETKVWVKPNTSPAFIDNSVGDKIQEMSNIESILKAPTEEELTEMLEAYLSPSSSSSNSAAKETVQTKQDSNQTMPNSSDNVKSALEQFDSLFNS